MFNLLTFWKTMVTQVFQKAEVSVVYKFLLSKFTLLDL